ncbi:Phage major capsid protein, HK97 [uncultured Caudovirales phage]|uniref:Phage major capsid protein, HK97 n=1 Tax=uncultured Caudovirales phage TaxID=2100421 RepID=A0A6J5T2Z2_9CAUD|nr:Phage major capsid protein, HK97 [uncultured Caudovirales phage]
MKLTFSTPIEAADTERRIISGKVMEYGAIGHTSVGPVVFEHGSIQIPSTAKIKLLAQHETNNPIGRAQSFSTQGDFMFGSFKISNSSKGTDYLTLAAEDLVSGLSVGVEVIASLPKDGYLLVTSAKMVEVSLVESPAFENAVVTKVAASEVEAGNSTSTTTITTTVTTTETESEDVMTTAPEPTTPEPVVEAPVVDAARPVSVPYNVLDSQRVRHGIDSPGQLLKHKILAAQGNEESKLWITAADDFSSAGLGFTPTQYLKSIVSTQGNFGRPAMECVDKQTLPASGMTINRPKFTTYPAVTVEAEGGAVQNTDAVSEYLTSTVSKYSGMQTISIELLERSDPGFFDAITRELQNNYDKVTDAAVITALTAGGTQATAVAATSAGIISYISQAAPAAYLASSYFAKNYLAGSSQWSLLLGATDSTGRPIYNAGNPMNSGGNAAATSSRGMVLDLNLFVDRNVVATTIDESAFIIAPEAFTVFESPTAYMSVNVVSNLQVQVAIYGYMATMVNVAGGIQRFNLT